MMNDRGHETGLARKLEDKSRIATANGDPIEGARISAQAQRLRAKGNR